jgi:hypothetical protein
MVWFGFNPKSGELQTKFVRTWDSRSYSFYYKCNPSYESIFFFYIYKLSKKILNLKILGLSVKLYLIVLGLFVTPTPEPKVIFIILIIILNFHNPSLSEFSCNIKPGALNMSLAASSRYKNMIIKKKKN